MTNRTASEIQSDILAALIAGDNDRALALQCELAEINNAAQQAAMADYVAKERARRAARYADKRRNPRIIGR